MPEAYGTQRLKLTPRDPNWIHAHWDFTRQQLRAANAQSAQGHLVLRMFERSPKGPLVSETHVQPESVRWLVHAPRPTTPYAAEIGFYDAQRQWVGLAVAEAVRTPPAGPSAERSFEVATVTPSGLLKRHDTAKALKAPESPPGAAPTWRETDLFSPGLKAPGPPGLVKELPSGLAVSPSSFGVSSWGVGEGVSSAVSSPMAAGPQPSFRLEVNAELIVYGATEPDATLHIGDRLIRLKPDGTFGFRFSLPDGTYSLPIKATSAKTGEVRTVRLRFVRHTEAGAGVGVAPQAPGLKPPTTENL